MKTKLLFCIISLLLAETLSAAPPTKIIGFDPEQFRETLKRQYLTPVGAKNYQEAEQLWLKKVDEQNDPDAMNALMVIYEIGLVRGKPEIEKGQKYFVRRLEYYLGLAKKGDVEAQYIVGKIYGFNNTFAETNREECFRWLGKAAAAGHQKAKEYLTRFTHSQDTQFYRPKAMISPFWRKNCIPQTPKMPEQIELLRQIKEIFNRGSLSGEWKYIGDGEFIMTCRTKMYSSQELNFKNTGFDTKGQTEFIDPCDNGYMVYYKQHSTSRLARGNAQKWHILTSDPGPGGGVFSIEYGINVPEETVEKLKTAIERIFKPRAQSYTGTYYRPEKQKRQIEKIELPIAPQ